MPACHLRTHAFLSLPAPRASCPSPESITRGAEPTSSSFLQPLRRDPSSRSETLNQDRGAVFLSIVVDISRLSQSFISFVHSSLTFGNVQLSSTQPSLAILYHSRDLNYRPLPKSTALYYMIYSLQHTDF